MFQKHHSQEPYRGAEEGITDSPQEDIRQEEICTAEITLQMLNEEKVESFILKSASHTGSDIVAMAGFLYCFD